MQLYGRKTSINVQKASWTLGELDLKFDWVDKEGKPGSIDTPEYRSLNPQVRVPTLIDGEIVVRQSNVVVRYLADTYGQGSLWPTDTSERVAADYWMDWQASDNWRNLVVVFWELIRTPPEQRNQAAVDDAVAKLCDDMAFLDHHLSDREFVTGDHFTMGDIPVGAAVHRFFVLPIERPSLPQLEAWYDRLKSRKAFIEYVMVPLP